MLVSAPSQIFYMSRFSNTLLAAAAGLFAAQATTIHCSAETSKTTPAIAQTNANADVAAAAAVADDAAAPPALAKVTVVRKRVKVWKRVKVVRRVPPPAPAPPAPAPAPAKPAAPTPPTSPAAPAADFADTARYGKIVSTGAIVRTRSSRSDDIPEFHGSLVRGPTRPKRAFITNYEETPWVILDLRAERQITALHILNANFNGKFATDAKPLLIEVSTDAKEWKKIHEDAEARLVWKVDIAAKPAAGRYVRISLKHGVPRTFQLNRVSVWGK
jgi:hypothetical protein